jgi:SHAQKYF class myb-like DNA-binding protein
LLCDDFCEIDEAGQYSIKPQVRAEIEKEMEAVHMNAPPVEMNSMPVEYQKKNLKTGRWTDEEHELFMEALLIYGKDWDQIELRVKTRDAQHCRSHAQKFFWKIVKYLEGVEDIPAI